VLFTDGGARFVRSPEAFAKVAAMQVTPGPQGNVIGTPEDLDEIFNLLEK
jgi:hypothetical protein